MARPIPPDDHEVLSDFAGTLLPGGLRFIGVWRAGAETVTQGLQSAVHDVQCLRGGSSQGKSGSERLVNSDDGRRAVARLVT
jgi:hypothetical protein